jgi:hypothetical protein
VVDLLKRTVLKPQTNADRGRSAAVVGRPSPCYLLLAPCYSSVVRPGNTTEDSVQAVAIFRAQMREHGQPVAFLLAGQRLGSANTLSERPYFRHRRCRWRHVIGSWRTGPSMANTRPGSIIRRRHGLFLHRSHPAHDAALPPLAPAPLENPPERGAVTPPLLELELGEVAFCADPLPRLRLVTALPAPVPPARPLTAV